MTSPGGGAVSILVTPAGTGGSPSGLHRRGHGGRHQRARRPRCRPSARDRVRARGLAASAGCDRGDGAGVQERRAGAGVQRPARRRRARSVRGRARRAPGRRRAADRAHDHGQRLALRAARSGRGRQAHAQHRRLEVRCGRSSAAGSPPSPRASCLNRSTIARVTVSGPKAASSPCWRRAESATPSPAAPTPRSSTTFPPAPARWRCGSPPRNSDAAQRTSIRVTATDAAGQTAAATIRFRR